MIVGIRIRVGPRRVVRAVPVRSIKSERCAAGASLGHIAVAAVVHALHVTVLKAQGAVIDAVGPGVIGVGEGRSTGAQVVGDEIPNAYTTVHGAVVVVERRAVRPTVTGAAQVEIVIGKRVLVGIAACVQILTHVPILFRQGRRR